MLGGHFHVDLLCRKASIKGELLLHLCSNQNQTYLDFLAQGKVFTKCNMLMKLNREIWLRLQSIEGSDSRAI